MVHLHSLIMPFTLLSIEGNIGSGKSTLLENLKQHYAGNSRVIFAPEPVAEWEKVKDKQGVTMLEKFYSNQEKYAFSFQMMAYMSRLSIFRRLVREAGDEPVVIITERSLCTDKYIFAKMLYDQGKMEEVNYQIYMTWFNEFANDFPIEHCFYIKADPEVCYQRIQKRARAGEDVIPMGYLQQCHEYHNDYVTQFSALTVLDGNEDVYQSPHIVQDWVERIDRIVCSSSVL